MNENSILQDLDLDTFVTLNDIYLGQDFLGVNEQGLNIYRTHVSCVLDINNLSKYRTLRQKFKTIKLPINKVFSTIKRLSLSEGTTLKREEKVLQKLQLLTLFVIFLCY